MGLRGGWGRLVWRGYIRAETEHKSIAVVAVPPVQAQPSVSKSAAFRPSLLCGASYSDGSFSLDSLADRYEQVEGTRSRQFQHTFKDEQSPGLDDGRLCGRKHRVAHSAASGQSNFAFSSVGPESSNRQVAHWKSRLDWRYGTAELGSMSTLAGAYGLWCSAEQIGSRIRLLSVHSSFGWLVLTSKPTVGTDLILVTKEWQLLVRMTLGRLENNERCEAMAELMSLFATRPLRTNNKKRPSIRSVSCSCRYGHRRS